jgi:DNA end-binding protein Ku
MTCPVHGPVDRGEITKGYEYEKGKYVIIDESDLENVRIDTNKTIEIEHFIDADELDPIFLSTPYYIAPDGPVANEAFCVVRDAMKRTGKIAIGRVVMSSKEQIVAVEVLGDGLLMYTLRRAAEVRNADAYFEDIAKTAVPKDQLQLAEHLIESKSQSLDTSAFTDRYQDALLDVIKQKIDGSEPVIVQEVEAAKVINFMDALKASVNQAGGGKPAKKPPAKSVKKKSATAKTRKTKRA